MKDSIVLCALRDVEDRLHALTEVRYYESLLADLDKYTLDEAAIITSEFRNSMEEIYEWLKAK